MPEFEDQFETLIQLSKELERAREAYKLLDEIWEWNGPYGTGKPMPNELRYKMQRFYNFDDSE